MSDVMYQFDNLYVLYCKYKSGQRILKSELVKCLRQGHKLNEDYLPLEEFMWFMADCIEGEIALQHTHNKKGLDDLECHRLAASIAVYRLDGVRGAKTRAIKDMAARKGCDERTIRNDIKRFKEEGICDVYDEAEQLYEYWCQQK